MAASPARRVAWNGEADEFWGAIERVRTGTDVEGDHAVLLDVIQEAMQAAMLRALLVEVEANARWIGDDLELSAGQTFAWADRLSSAIDASHKAAYEGKELEDV